MVRTEISLFLKNVPGELGRLSALLGASGVNIDALIIQDASSYVQQLFQARGKLSVVQPPGFVVRTGIHTKYGDDACRRLPI